MPSKSSGRIVKPKRAIKTTPHQKNHRWESFTTKVSKLHSLDPLRKVRRHDLDAEDISTTTSYFRNGVEKWADLNISKPFTDFKRAVLPLCESLPQILHFEEKIMDLLATYIGLQDKEALEPLLDLLTAFAHDLGVRFEKHYQRSLELIVSVAGRPQNVEVIEWTFAALAWLFKYLSRLLVPDLRPTYDMLAPLLGKSRHPPHIARFAAEATSFLIKKAAAPAHREKALPSIIQHIRDDLRQTAETKQFGLYYHGIMTMFAEAMKGSGTTLHSTAPEIFNALLAVVPVDELDLQATSVWSDVCCGVLTSVIHHSTVETFEPLANAVIAEAPTGPIGPHNDRDERRALIFVRLFGVIAGVRNSTRVSDWSGLVQALVTSLECLSKTPEKTFIDNESSTWKHVIVNTAIVWSQAPMDSLLSSISDLTKILTREPFMGLYIPFCASFAELNPERFHGLFQKPFQRFIVAHWSDGSNEEMLCSLLPKMVASGALPASGEKESCTLPQSWQAQIVSKFERLEITPFPERGSYDKDAKTWRDKCLPKYSSLLQVLESTTVHPSTSARIAELLLRKLKLALRPSSSLATDESHFIVSQGFRAYLRMSKASGSVDASISPLLRAAAPRFAKITGFLDAFLDYERELVARGLPDKDSSSGSESPIPEENPLVKSLIDNLSAPSHDLRLVSLKILEMLKITPDQLSCLSTMIAIEQIPLDHQSPRIIAVHLRKLGQSYNHLDEKSWLRQAVPSFLFGMMTLKLSPVWDDAIEAMKTISQSKSADEALSNLAFEWLDVPSPKWEPHLAGNMKYDTTDFECQIYKRLQNEAQETARLIDDPTDVMLQSFEERQELVSARPQNARYKALKILSAIPALAEKRSRKLVPYLLAVTDGGDSSSDEEDADQETPQKEAWFLTDKKALLGVFAQFVNPKVLYQSQKVYNALLTFMAHRDIEVQKLALKAILTWKQEGIKPYQEHLEYLLDEARFKNELTVLFQGDQKIQPEHRSELMPVLLRLLYGRATSKKGAASGRNGLHATRLAVIRNLSVEDLGGFIKIALGELWQVRIVDDSGIKENIFKDEIMPARKQVGMLNMTESIINELGTDVSLYMDPLVNAVLYCLVSTCRKLQAAGEDVDEEGEHSETSLLKVARTTSLKCVCALFRNNTSFDWTPYREVMISEAVSPGIEKLAVETSQGVSWTWRLLETWSLLPRNALFLSLDQRIIPEIIKSLSIEKGKDEPKIFALGIVRNLVKLAQAPAVESEFNELIQEELLHPNIDGMLGAISQVLREQHDIGRNLLEACVDTVVEISPLVKESKNVENLLAISTYLLRQPLRRVNPKVKGSILLILQHFIVLDDLQGNTELKQTVYDTLASLFSFFKDKENREALSRVLVVFAAQEPSLQEVADLCTDLNSYVEGRLDEPDYDKRLAAFRSITRERDVRLTIEQWLPLLHNMVYFLRQDEEFGILSTNAADVLCKFVDAAVSVWDQPLQVAFAAQLSDVILPAIYAGVRESSEAVRREVLRLLSHLATQLRAWEPLTDLSLLAPATDEESDKAFFFNILTPAVSRQVQALQLLISVNDRSPFSSKNVSQIFIPLLEHFIFGREEGSDDQGLGAQATSTIASLTLSLDWAQYRAIMRRYISFLESKPELQKQVIRLLDKVADSLVLAKGQVNDAGMDLDQSESGQAKSRLATSLPNEIKIGDEVSNNFLPLMLKHLHDKDEETVSARVPVAVIIVKLLTILPENMLNTKLPGVLTDICHILRSKAWESREMARNTLAKIACILGPGSFGFVLKELRGALTKGYQLHVLSYSLHTLLLAVIPEFGPGDLDYCLDSIMAIIMDDIFGATGQEKDAEEYISKMKEVKSSKSQDSMELIAKNASITQLASLIRPLQSLLSEKLDVRTVRRIDELLNRITSGILQNRAADSRDTLVFCYEVIQEVYKSQKPRAEAEVDPRVKRYLVQKWVRTNTKGEKYTHKLIRFAIDVLRSVLRKHDSLRNAANVSGFLPILGDAVIGGEEEVKIAAFKILAVLVKVPFKTNESADLYKVAFKEALKSISISTTTTTDIAQTALKLCSQVIRDRREIPIKDAAVDMLLGKLKDDLTQPLYRHVTFNFLRAVLDRKVETATVYDTLDYVGTIMITNDDKDTRDLARGAYFQYLREYPQQKKRWTKTKEFVVANLKYEREGGRLSVMEIIHLLLMKTADDFVQEVIATSFIPLVFVLANDESERCRLAAGELIKEIFRKADKERLQKFLTLLRSWTSQDENPAVLKLALETFAYYFDAKETNTKDKKDLDLVIKKVIDVLSDGKSDWELSNTALRVIQTLLGKYPSRILSEESQGLWTVAVSSLAHPKEDVVLTAIKLLGMYLADFAGNTANGADARTLEGSYGLTLDQDRIAELVRLMLEILSGLEVEEGLAAEAVRILVFLGTYLDIYSDTSDSEERDEEDDFFKDEEVDVTLGYVFSKLAAIIRRETPPRASSLVGKLAAIEALEVFCNKTTKEDLEPFVRTILRPLRHLTDPSIRAPYVLDEVFKTRYESLKTKAQAIMELLQQKLGASDYTKDLLAVGENIKERRQQRSSKRKIEAITQPEKFGREKRKKMEKKKERKKAKGQEHRNHRRGY